MSNTQAKTLASLERQERYEECATLRDRAKAISDGDAMAYTRLTFDREGLIESGFCKPGATWQDVHDRVVKFFGYEAIFEHSTSPAAEATAKHDLAVIEKQEQ